MATLAEWQQRLFDPAFVSTPVTHTTQIRSAKNHVLFVPIQPEVLAEQAKAQSVEQYSLARVMKSEGWKDGFLDEKARGLTAIGQVIVNISPNLQITKKLTHSIFAEVSGFYGEQHGRVASTSLDPLPYHMGLALDILMRNVENVAGPSTHFLAPWPSGALQNNRPLPDFVKLMEEWHGPKDQLAWSGPRGLSTKAFLLFYHEPDPVKRAASLKLVLENYHRDFHPLVSGGGGGGLSGIGPKAFAMAGLSVLAFGGLIKALRKG